MNKCTQEVHMTMQSNMQKKHTLNRHHTCKGKPTTIISDIMNHLKWMHFSNLNKLQYFMEASNYLSCINLQFDVYTETDQ